MILTIREGSTRFEPGRGAGAAGLNDTDLAQTIVGDSLAIRELRAAILRVAPRSLPVLIQGPTGSGKELVANALHRASGRWGGYVPFNVCAVPEGVFEDALFGHVRGAFTGAAGPAAGYMAEADEGTLFLDEISGLAPGLQATLLRAIETGQFRPVGGGRDCHSNFRVVAASNEDLTLLCRQGRFRLDLLHRLDGITLVVPPLQERREDIPLLLGHFLNQAAPGIRVRITSSAFQLLEDYDWPGNVRELRNVVERVLLLADGCVLGRGDFTRALPRHAGPQPGAPLETANRQQLIAVLEACGWCPRRTAASLQVHWTTVYRWMREHGIHRPRQRRADLPRTDHPVSSLPTADGISTD